MLETNSNRSQNTEEQRKRYVFRMKLPNDQIWAAGIKVFNIIFSLRMEKKKLRKKKSTKSKLSKSAQPLLCVWSSLIQLAQWFRGQFLIRNYHECDQKRISQTILWDYMFSGFPKGEFKLKTQNAKQWLIWLLSTMTHSWIPNTIFCEQNISKFL